MTGEKGVRICKYAARGTAGGIRVHRGAPEDPDSPDHRRPSPSVGRFPGGAEEDRTQKRGVSKSNLGQTHFKMAVLAVSKLSVYELSCSPPNEFCSSEKLIHSLYPHCRAAFSNSTQPSSPTFVRICFVGWKQEDCRIAKKILRDVDE